MGYTTKVQTKINWQIIIMSFDKYVVIKMQI